MSYARVIVDIAARNVDRMFTYAVPQGMALVPGMRVYVPFGPRRLSGIVMELSATSDVDASKLRQVEAAIDEYPVLTEDLLPIAFYMRESCHCSLAQALRAMLPSQVRSEKIRPLTRLAVRLVVPAEKAMQAASRAKKQQELILLLQDGEPKRVAQLDMPGALAVARAMEKKGIAEVFAQPVRRIPYKDLTPSGGEVTPTAHQAMAIAAVEQAMDADGGAFLLNGVTGSGKTEVYIRIIKRALDRGKGAIVLVPEISLTPQMAAWFRARFGDVAAILHSGLSDGERFDEWRRIREGEARVVIGARSAVFAPVEGLGLIIVDEEHEQSYLSDNHPRYDARKIALHRCKALQAVALLGSATPSVDSYARALRGDYALLEMPKRVAERALADVSVVDMRAELVSGNPSIFSRELQEKLEETIESGNQAVLFMNRRGYASYIKCRACGHSVRCSHCDVTMTYHKLHDTLECHYCGNTQRRPRVCPECQSPLIKPFGIGTQKVEEIFKKEFPGARCVRMDADTVKGKDSLVDILNTFRSGKAQVLIGTQMVAKGHDFPNVTLVGVIMADMSLNVPDYRSEERTFQLLTQVAGRAGRGEKAGEVVIQTYEPEHYAIQMAAMQDYRAFYEQEIKRRRQRLYPPYTRVLRVLVLSRNEGDAKAVCEAIGEQLKAYLFDEPGRRKQSIQVRAMEAPLSKIRDEYRHQVFIKLYAHGAEPLIAEISHMVQEYASEVTEASVDFEIDPVSFL